MVKGHSHYSTILFFLVSPLPAQQHPLISLGRTETHPAQTEKKKKRHTQISPRRRHTHTPCADREEETHPAQTEKGLCYCHTRSLTSNIYCTFIRTKGVSLSKLCVSTVYHICHIHIQRAFCRQREVITPSWPYIIIDDHILAYGGQIERSQFLMGVFLVTVCAVCQHSYAGRRQRAC